MELNSLYKIRNENTGEIKFFSSEASAKLYIMKMSINKEVWRLK